MNNMIALITATGARPKQIKLCAEFMRRQDYKGEVLWVIVDDAIPITINDIGYSFRDGWTIEKVFPSPTWMGDNTQSRNLLAGIERLKEYQVKAAFIIEDDDYYCVEYLSRMMEELKESKVTGQQRTVYYDVVHRGWMRNENLIHASLFQTAFTSDILPIFETACKMGKKFIDMNFFRLVRTHKINLFSNGKDLAIGIKGLPGRPGIGMGHRMDVKMTKDPEFVKLKELIGEDYKYYI